MVPPNIEVLALALGFCTCWMLVAVCGVALALRGMPGAGNAPTPWLLLRECLAAISGANIRLLLWVIFACGVVVQVPVACGAAVMPTFVVVAKPAVFFRC